MSSKVKQYLTELGRDPVLRRGLKLYAGMGIMISAFNAIQYPFCSDTIEVVCPILDEPEKIIFGVFFWYAVIVGLTQGAVRTKLKYGHFTMSFLGAILGFMVMYGGIMVTRAVSFEYWQRTNLVFSVNRWEDYWIPWGRWGSVIFIALLAGLSGDFSGSVLFRKRHTTNRTSS